MTKKVERFREWFGGIFIDLATAIRPETDRLADGFSVGLPTVINWLVFYNAIRPRLHIDVASKLMISPVVLAKIRLVNCASERTPWPRFRI